MISVGFDLSLTASGLARMRLVGDERRLLVEEPVLVGRAGVTNMALSDQIDAVDALAQQIVDWDLAAGVPDVAVLEAPDNGRTYGGVTERAALFWAIAWHIKQIGVPRFYLPTSQQVKIYAAGTGSATKDQMKDAVTQHWPWWEHRRNDNLADAAAMAELGLALLGFPSVDLPKEHTRVLSSIRSSFDPPRRVTAPKKPRKAAK